MFYDEYDENDIEDFDGMMNLYGIRESDLIDLDRDPDEIEEDLFGLLGEAEHE